MKKHFIIVTLVLCQAVVFAQDKKVTKIAKYIEKGNGTEAKKLLDELDSKKEYQSDIYYWYVRTVYYRDVALTNPNSTSELAEARKSFDKLVEFDKTDPSKSLTQYIPQIKKDLYEGKNQITKSGSSSQPGAVNQANDGNTVTLTQIGQGKTKDTAKYNALRNTIEKAFGTFISSNTTLLNDELIKDEIVSVSSGNIQSFEILSETQMPDGSFSSIVKATVSIGKLLVFCESKGIRIDFKGGLFAANIKLQELNLKNEESVMLSLLNSMTMILQKGFDYSISSGEPMRKEFYTDNLSIQHNLWTVEIQIEAHANKNFVAIGDMIEAAVKGISLSSSDIITYNALNLDYYQITLNEKKYFLRSFLSVWDLLDFFKRRVPVKSLDFIFSNSIKTIKGSDILLSAQRHFNLETIERNGIVGTGGLSGGGSLRCVSVNYPVCQGDVKSSNVAGDIELGMNRQDEPIYYEMWADDKGQHTYRIIEGQGQENIKLNLKEIANSSFHFSFTNAFLSVDDLSKITEFKVTPKY